jgi:flagellar hook-basal body complex protein FliE
MELVAVVVGLGLVCKIFSYSFKMFGWQCFKTNPKPRPEPTLEEIKEEMQQEIQERKERQEKLENVREKLLDYNDKLYENAALQVQKASDSMEHLKMEFRWLMYRMMNK